MLRLGEKIGLADIKMLDVPTPLFFSKDELIGQIISIDHFGNLITNIDQETLDRFQGGREFGDLVIRLGRFKIEGVSKSYDTVKIDSPVALLGSRNLLEISINQAEASAHFKANVGDIIKIRPLAKKA
jgi:S-adenosylmethionine hydrolase